MTLWTTLLSRTPLQKVSPSPATLLLREQLCAYVADFVGETEGAAVRDFYMQEAPSALHRFLAPRHIPSLVAQLDKRYSRKVYDWAIGIAQDELGMTDPFYFDEQVYFRINFPFPEAMRGPRHAEIEAASRDTTVGGKLKAAARIILGRGRRVSSDEHSAFDLVTYNRDRPKATWSHGPHIDTWYGHAYDSINFWWAIFGVNSENSMVLFPEAHKYSMPFDKRDMYLTRDFRTPRPADLKLEDGELLLFDAELLHSTRLNTSDETRFAITLRANQNLPTYSDKTTHHLHTRWHKSTDYKAGQTALKNIGRSVPDRNYPPFPNRTAPYVVIERPFASGSSISIEVPYLDTSENIIVLHFKDIELLLIRLPDGTFAVTGAVCPHVGVPLRSGHVVDGLIQCPAHGVRFDPKTGLSDCQILRIRTYKAARTGEKTITIEREASTVATAR